MTASTLRAPCYLGKRYATEAAARESRAAATAGATVPGDRCDRCEGWHVLGGPVAQAVRAVRHQESAHQSAEDQATRLAVLARDGYRCVCCGQSIVGRPHSLGHRVRASQGGPYTPVNLLTFLGWGNGLTGSDDHHRRIDTRRDPRDEARGLTVRSWKNHAQIPVTIATEDGPRRVWLTPDGQYADKRPALAGDAA